MKLKKGLLLHRCILLQCVCMCVFVCVCVCVCVCERERERDRERERERKLDMLLVSLYFIQVQAAGSSTTGCRSVLVHYSLSQYTSTLLVYY